MIDSFPDFISLSLNFGFSFSPAMIVYGMFFEFAVSRAFVILLYMMIVEILFFLNLSASWIALLSWLIDMTRAFVDFIGISASFCNLSNPKEIPVD